MKSAKRTKNSEKIHRKNTKVCEFRVKKVELLPIFYEYFLKKGGEKKLKKFSVCVSIEVKN